MELELSGPIQSEFKIENFHISKLYAIRKSKPVKKKIIDYSIKEDIHKILGNTVAVYSQFKFNEDLPNYFKKIKLNTLKILHFIKPIMNGRTSFFRLKRNEKDYVNTDSLRQYYQSEEYALKQDSSYNKITWAKVLWEGVGRKNTFKGYSLYVWPLISQFNIWYRRL